MTDRDGTKTVYMFLPYYKRGNLQDNINANNINKTYFQEKDLLQFFLKVCYALRVLHRYQLPTIPIMTPSETITTTTSSSSLSSSACTSDQFVPYGRVSKKKKKKLRQNLLISLFYKHIVT